MTGLWTEKDAMKGAGSMSWDAFFFLSPPALLRSCTIQVKLVRSRTASTKKVVKEYVKKYIPQLSKTAKKSWGRAVPWQTYYRPSNAEISCS